MIFIRTRHLKANGKLDITVRGLALALYLRFCVLQANVYVCSIAVL